jgi:hypothetical protein
MGDQHCDENREVRLCYVALCHSTVRYLSLCRRTVRHMTLGFHLLYIALVSHSYYNQPQSHSFFSHYILTVIGCVDGRVAIRSFGRRRENRVEGAYFC